MCPAGGQVQVDNGQATRGNLVPQQGRAGIDETALYSAISDDEFALLAKGMGLRVCERKQHGFQRMPAEARPEVFRPIYIETAVGGLKRIDQDAALRQQGYPRPGGPGLRPAGAAQGQDNSIGRHYNLPSRGCKAQAAISIPTEPVMAGVVTHPAGAQARQP